MSKKNRKTISEKKQEEIKPALTPKQKNYIYTGIFFAVVAILFIVNNTRSEPESGPYPPNYKSASSNTSMAPEFTLKTTDGGNLSLSDYRGKVVIIDFWATWCAPCRKGIPDLVDLKQKYGDDLEIIGISLDQETISQVVPFMQKNNINYPVVYGNYQVTQQYGGVRSIPTSFVVDQEGKIVDSHVGLVSKNVYENLIDKLL
ncbi:MAG: TlpA family protein disulfide reductase [Melioribacteraceae bacterium]|nr:TlpA family protein disulfide reductase [Melioribacteraceae bacterium]MCF8266422.1 TlpA family protein disulfide reductase [Melioribacteraceae bacterium]